MGGVWNYPFFSSLLAGVGGFVDLGPVAGSTPLNTRLVIDNVLMEVASFVAQLATLRGARSLVADAPDRFFYHLASALEAQGLSKKLVADMCGLALRSYQKRMQRLAESRSDAGRTLWEAVFAHLHERTTATRAGGSSRSVTRASRGAISSQARFLSGFGRSS